MFFLTGITVFTDIWDQTIHNFHQTTVFHLFLGITAQMQRHVYQRGRQRHPLFSKLSALVKKTASSSIQQFHFLNCRICTCTWTFFFSFGKEDIISAVIEKSAKLEDSFGHLFDFVIVNDDISRATEELIRVAGSVSKDLQWVPAAWVE